MKLTLRNALVGSRSLLFCLFLSFSFVIKSFGQVTFTETQYGVDEWLKLVVCNHIPSSIPSGTTVLVLDKSYVLSSPINSIQKGVEYKANSSGLTYSIYFTELPVAKISVSYIGDINRDEEIDGNIKIRQANGEEFLSPMGIKIRGASSASFDKKSYRVQLRDDLGEDKDATLFGMREDKRWLMLAMFNEQLRLNNKISHDLWLKMHKLYYQDDEPDANSTIRSVYVEAFINNSYRGVYLFTENTDRKQYKLKKTNGATARGELYKADGAGNTKFESLPPKPAPGADIWGGWEMSYPDPDELSWDNLYNFTQFVQQSSRTDFVNQIEGKLDFSSTIDYIIFLNLLQAYDNTGKNTFLAKYKENEPYFYGVWDLDGTWGYDTGGTRINDITDFLSNTLFDRLINLNPQQFKKRLAGRWFTLRENILSENSLFNDIETQYNFLTSNGVYKREGKLWSTSNSMGEVNYLKNRTSQRLLWLDNYFNNLTDNCNAPALTISPVEFTNGESVSLLAAGCPGIVKWYSSLTGGSVLSVGNTFTTPTLYAETSYYASCTIGSCTSTTRSSINVSPNCSKSVLNYENISQVPAEYSTRKNVSSRALIVGETLYNAGESIILLPGFKADGVVFEARIEGCD